jgi:hypothetical protein
MSEPKITVELGQQVIMIEGSGKSQIEKRGTVTKIGRVWIEVTRDGQTWTQRYRLDDQTDGSNYAARARFRTLDQWAEQKRQIEAERFLREQGIEVGYRSPWRERVVELAELIRGAEK